MKPVWMALCLALGGCAQGVVCGDNTTAVEGNCFGEPPVEFVEPDDPRVFDALFDPDDCGLLPAGDELDLLGQCAGGVCVGDTVSEAIEVAAQPTCRTAGLQGLLCDWNGVTAQLDDKDLDGEPDLDGIVKRIQVVRTFDGSDADGLGVGVDIACFLSILPPPDRLGLVRDGDAVIPVEAIWDTRKLHVGTSGEHGWRYAPVRDVTYIYLGSFF